MRMEETNKDVRTPVFLSKKQAFPSCQVLLKWSHQNYLCNMYQCNVQQYCLKKTVVVNTHNIQFAVLAIFKGTVQ